jgi:hypothetical protein
MSLISVKNVMHTATKPKLTVVPPPVLPQQTKKMKKWPDDPSRMIPYNQLIDPLKSIITTGYRLFRRNDIKSFEYEGYNIGEQERTTHPSPKNRFKETSLQEVAKSGKTLIDIVINVIFLLGVEQGRRAQYKEHKSIEELCETLEIYRNSNKDLRIKNDELEVYIEEKKLHPSLSDEELLPYIKNGIAKRRTLRIEDYKKDLLLDKRLNEFKFKSKIKMKAKELISFASSLSKEICSAQQWSELLTQRGWTLEEWRALCKKKNIKSEF